MIVLREGQPDDPAAIAPLLIREHKAKLAMGEEDITLRLMWIFAQSEDTFGLEEDGELLCLGGIVPVSGTILTRVGYMWMGITDRFMDHPKKVLFAKESRRWLNAVKERYVALYDVCAVDDVKTAMWLKFLGFKFGPITQSQVDGSLVYPVRWVRWD